MEHKIEVGHPQYEAFLRRYQEGERAIVWKAQVWRAITDGQGGVYFVAEMPHTFQDNYGGSSLAIQARDVLK